MIYKTLINTKTREFCHFYDGQLYAGSIPKLFPVTAEKKAFLDYLEQYDSQSRSYLEEKFKDIDFVLTEVEVYGFP